MAETTMTIDAPPEAVYAVLADGRRYAEWVVGAKRIRGVDPSWPEPGSRFHHVVGFGPVEIKDHSEVLEVEPNKRIVLRVRARPAGAARVELDLVARDGATEVRMNEYPTSGLAKTIDNPLLEATLKARNLEALRRLKREVEEDAPA